MNKNNFIAGIVLGIGYLIFRKKSNNTFIGSTKRKSALTNNVVTIVFSQYGQKRKMEYWGTESQAKSYLKKLLGIPENAIIKISSKKSDGYLMEGNASVI